MINNILFDLDGTLVDSAEGILASVQYALQTLGIKSPGEQALRGFLGPPLDESFPLYCGTTGAQTTEAIAHFRSYFKKRGIFQNAPYPGIPTLLEMLKAKQKKLYIATTKPKVFATQILETHNLLSYFGYVAGSSLANAGSPKDVLIREVLQHTGIEAEDAIMVGDRKHDIRGAAQHNMLSMGVLYGYGNQAEFEEAGASYIVGSVQELGCVLTTL